MDPETTPDIQKTAPEAYYCGSVHQKGISFLGRGLQSAKAPSGWPFSYGAECLDAVYAPRSKHQYNRSEQPEGHARVVLVGDWTVLAFWDRSGPDTRGGIHSTFVLRGTHAPDAALQYARDAFPEIFARLTFDVKLEGAGWM